MAALLIVPGGAAALVLLLIIGNAVQFFGRHHPAKVAFRLLILGTCADGIVRANATWTRDATSALPTNRWHHQSRLTWWTRAARIKRVALAWAVLLGVPLAGYGLLTAPTLTTVLAYALAASLLLTALARGVHWFATRHHRRLVQPLASALAKELGTDASVVGRSLAVAPRHELSGYGHKVAHLALPDGFRGRPRDRDAVEQIIAARLPLEDPRFGWRLDLRPGRLAVYAGTEPPPAILRLEECAAIMDALPRGEYFLGAGRAGDDGQYERYTLDTSREDPDVAINARSRRGKTNLASCFTAQALRKGEQVWAVDPKTVSLAHFAGVPGFRLANDPAAPAAMVALILEFEQEMNRARAAGRTGTHRTLVLEEINALNALLNIWWQRTEPGAGIKDNPAVRAIQNVLLMGAQFNHRVWCTGQNLTQDSLWGLRAAFGTVLMSGYTDAQWRFIVGTGTVPAQPEIRGRMYLVRNGIPSLIQIPVADARASDVPALVRPKNRTLARFFRRPENRTRARCIRASVRPRTCSVYHRRSLARATTSGLA
jgi:hypothetical protein